MLGLPVFLGLLIGNAAAIDVGLNYPNGGSVNCVGLAANTCCSIGGSSDSPFGSVTFKYIPTDWKVAGSAHRGPACGAIWDSQFSNGRTTFTLSNGWFGGAGFHFGSVKRSEPFFTDSARPNVVGLADGTRYNVTNWDDASFNAMVCILSSYYYLDNIRLGTCTNLIL